MTAVAGEFSREPGPSPELAPVRSSLLGLRSVVRVRGRIDHPQQVLQYASTFRDPAHRLRAVGWCAVFVYAFCPATTTHRHPFLGVYIIGGVTSSESLSVGPVKQRSMSIVAVIYFYRKAFPCWISLEPSLTPSPSSSPTPSSSSRAPSTKSPSPLATQAPALRCGGFCVPGTPAPVPGTLIFGGGPSGPPRQG